MIKKATQKNLKIIALLSFLFCSFNAFSQKSPRLQVLKDFSKS